MLVIGRPWTALNLGPKYLPAYHTIISHLARSIFFYCCPTLWPNTAIQTNTVHGLLLDCRCVGYVPSRFPPTPPRGAASCRLRQLLPPSATAHQAIRLAPPTGPSTPAWSWTARGGPSRPRPDPAARRGSALRSPAPSFLHAWHLELLIVIFFYCRTIKLGESHEL